MSALTDAEQFWDGPIPRAALDHALGRNLTPEQRLERKLHSLKLDIALYHAEAQRGYEGAAERLEAAEKAYRDLTMRAVHDACDRARDCAVWPLAEAAE